MLRGASSHIHSILRLTQRTLTQSSSVTTRETAQALDLVQKRFIRDSQTGFTSPDYQGLTLQQICSIEKDVLPNSRKPDPKVLLDTHRATALLRQINGY